jgi:hypothetical protein
LTAIDIAIVVRMTAERHLLISKLPATKSRKTDDRERRTDRHDVASNAMQVVQIRSGRNSGIRELNCAEEVFLAIARTSPSKWLPRSMKANASGGTGIEAGACGEATSCRAFADEKHPAIRQHGALVECIGQCDAACAIGHGA